MAFDTGYALVIGVGSYQHEPQLNVPLTVEDAQAIVKILHNLNHCAYPEQQIQFLHDETATRQNIEDALDNLAKTLHDTDTLSVFYSGHGDYGDDGYYLTTHDTRLDGNQVAVGSGLHERALLEKLNAIKAKRVFLFFNACHSGEISPGTLGSPDEQGANIPEQTANALLATGEGRVIITACRETQKSYFSPSDSMTLFAQSLVEALKGKGIPSRKGYISIFDLYEKVFSQVKADVEKLFGQYGVVQEPELTIQKGLGVMAVALHSGKTPGSELGAGDAPDALNGAVREVDAAESQRALQQILSGQVNLAAGGDMQDVQVLERGDYINASGSQGFVNRPSGPINQVFGNSTVINTGGGDYAGRDMYKSAPATPANENAVSLQSICSQVTEQIEQAEIAELEDLADDLRAIELALNAAIKAESAGNTERRDETLERAKQAIGPLSASYPQLGKLALSCNRLIERLKFQI
ncbi:caspase family protein [Leptothoe sp. EHU-05/26/07-4]